MKKLFMTLVAVILLFNVTGCTETESTNEVGEKTRNFSVGETATVNKTNIKINSVTKLEKECSWEWDGECQSYTEPDNDYFLIIDLTITNNGDEDLGISSIMSFELKNSDGEKGEYEFLTNSIKSQLDGSVMPGDLLKGQIAYDVKETDELYFYYRDSLLDSNVKFTISKSDIKEQR